LLSHFLRALRWLILLKPITQELNLGRGNKPISLWHSFSAVIYGYAANVVVPRGGEIVRLISITKMENVPWASVLSTLFVDRLLDIVMLGLIVGSTLTILPGSIRAQMPWLLPSGIVLGIGSMLILMALPKLAAIIGWFTQLPAINRIMPDKIKQTLMHLLSEFDNGTKSLTDPLSYPSIALLTFSIWFLYWLNVYLTALALHLTNSVSLADSFIVFTIGSVGVLIPTPGSIGSFHLLVSQALMLCSGLTQDNALAFATVMHIFAFVLVPCLASLVCLVINNRLSAKS
jgi:glycosyltransferase 2 family protein